MQSHSTQSCIPPSPHPSLESFRKHYMRRLLFTHESFTELHILFVFQHCCASNSVSATHSLKFKHDFILLVIVRQRRLKVLLKGTLAAAVEGVVDPPRYTFRLFEIEDETWQHKSRTSQQWHRWFYHTFYHTCPNSTEIETLNQNRDWRLHSRAMCLIKRMGAWVLTLGWHCAHKHLFCFVKTGCSLGFLLLSVIKSMWI